jgi:histidine triad (HIT) family protein
MTDECIFCKIAGGEIPVTLLYEDDLVVAFTDIHPVAPYHVLIVPRAHVPTLMDLTEEHAAAMARVATVAAIVAQQLGFAENGFRLTLNSGPDAEQVVPHLHFHLLGGRKFGWPPG